MENWSNYEWITPDKKWFCIYEILLHPFFCFHLIAIKDIPIHELVPTNIVITITAPLIAAANNQKIFFGPSAMASTAVALCF